MDEVADRPVIDLKATLGQLRDEPAQGEISLWSAAIAKHDARLRSPSGCSRPSCPARRSPFAGNAEPSDTHAKLSRRLTPRQASLLNRRNNSLAQIKGIGAPIG